MKSHLRIKNKRELGNAFALLTQVGVTMITTIILMFFLGRFLDEQLNTGPWLLFVCILLGVAAAFRNLYVLTASLWEKKKNPKH